ncbi:MAG: hypothetical protein R3F48_01750 [Candidatus Zixiibacteriota bacterium]
MRGNQFATAVALGCFIVLSFSQALHAGDNEFKVTSYIPEHFTDFQWYVEGGFNLGGNSSNMEQYSSLGYLHTDEDSKSSDQALSMTSNSDYLFVTRTMNFSSHTSVYSFFNFENTNTTESPIGTQPTTVYNSSDYQGREVTCRLEQDFSAIIYPTDVFFSKFDVAFSYDGDFQPKQTNHNYRKHIYDPVNPTYIVIDDDERKRPLKTYRYTINAALSQGIGRVEYGVYGATALYIIDELDAKGLLIKRPDYDDMMKLADLLYQYENSSSDDARIHRMESIQGILEFLSETGALADSGPISFVVCTDVLDYFPKDNRAFGFRIGAGVGLSYSFYKSDQTNESIDRRYQYYYDDANTSIFDSVRYFESTSHDNKVTQTINRGPYWVLTAGYYRPIDLKWQLGVSGEFRRYFDAESETNYNYYIYSSTVTSGESRNKTSYDDWYSASIAGQVTYIMNSRTSGAFINSYSFNQRKRTNENYLGDLSHDDSRSNTIQFTSQLSYRLAIPTTLTAELSYIITDSDNYYDEVWRENDGRHWGIAVGIAHYLY